MVFPVVGGNLLDTGYEIDNSLRFNDGDSPNVSNNPNAGSGSDGSRTQFSISMWVKRSTLALGDNNKQQFLTSAVATNNFYGTIKFNGDDKIQINLINSGSDQDEIVTNAVYRDTSAWYHFFFAFDKTQAALSNGIKLYVNGVLQTFDTTTYTQNQGYHFFRPGKSHYIGNYNGQEGYFDGYMAEVHFVDGQVKAHTDFGETNDNGVWIPKDYTGTHGTYGFHLEFKQTGTSENSSGIGADTSGNDEHFAVANLAATDVTTDTPTNNFATLNPLSNSLQASYSEGNLDEACNDNYGVGATQAFANGKWYWEVKITAGDNNLVGIANSDEQHRLATVFGIINYSITAYGVDGRIFREGSTVEDVDDTYGANDIVGLAVDMDSGTRTVQFYKNGSTFGSAVTLPTNWGFTLPMIRKGGSSQTSSFNFGNPAFSISSGNADANGYGNFEYAPPSGYYALCTKNLAEYG